MSGGGGGSGSLGGICMGQCGILGVGVAVCAAVAEARRFFEGESRCYSVLVSVLVLPPPPV